jgi:hypothetical protein
MILLGVSFNFSVKYLFFVASHAFYAFELMRLFWLDLQTQITLTSLTVQSLTITALSLQTDQLS